MKKFKIVGKPLVGEKYVHGKRNNNAKFSGHYVRPRNHNVRGHALRSYQFHSGNSSSQHIMHAYLHTSVMILQEVTLCESQLARLVEPMCDGCVELV